MVSIKTASSVVIGYMILAFGWWAYSIWNKNDQLTEIRKEVLALKYDPKAEIPMNQSATYLKIEKDWHKGHRMVIAEGLFFMGCLIFGLWLINRSANREVQLARQRRNFLLSITHELKSPIASMRLILDTIAKRDLTKLQSDKLCASGLKDAARLQNLVEDLLLAARLEDKWQPLPEPIALNKMATECADALKTRFPDSNINILIPTTLPILQFDKAGLTAVLKNLIENAVKYAPPGSPITVDAAKQSNKLLIQVKDEGPGIPPSERVAVFEKFYRIGNEETRQTTGTGLGLYIVKQVVEAHRGTIEISDNQPQGTIFSILI